MNVRGTPQRCEGDKTWETADYHSGITEHSRLVGCIPCGWVGILWCFKGIQWLHHQCLMLKMKTLWSFKMSWLTRQQCHIPEDLTFDAKNYPAAKTIHCSMEQTCFTVSMKFLYLAAVMCYRDSVVCDPATTAFADRWRVLQHTSCCDKCVNKYLSTMCGQHVRYDLAACLTRHLQHHWAAIEQEVDQAWWWATWNTSLKHATLTVSRFCTVCSMKAKSCSKLHLWVRIRLFWDVCSPWTNYPQWWRWQNCMKCWYLLTHWHSVTSQKTLTLIDSAVRTSNVAQIFFYKCTTNDIKCPKWNLWIQQWFQSLTHISVPDTYFSPRHTFQSLAHISVPDTHFSPWHTFQSLTHISFHSTVSHFVAP